MENPHVPRRVFVYGMQSSGASLFTFFLAQQPDTVAVIDLWAYFVAPTLIIETTTILKAVVCHSIGIEEHLDSYQPDFKILFLRNPLDIYTSLQLKEYRDVCGGIEDKFRILEAVYHQAAEFFNAIIHYETFVQDPPGVAAKLNGMGLPIPHNAHTFPRSLDQIAQFNQEHSDWCRETFNTRWQFGSIREEKILPPGEIGRAPSDVEKIEQLWTWCPGLMMLSEEVAQS